MNIMNMPGFTAEASLYKTNQRYQLLASWAGVTRVYVGLAQLLRPPPEDGDGESCTPGNLGCLTDPDSPTGCRRFFLRRDCEIVPLAPCQGCPPPPVTCGPCVGFRQCSDGTQRSCSV
jgi:hypothetical protein